MWEEMLMSAGIKNSKQVFIHGFITANGQKMSKSLGNVINPIDLVKKYGTDAVRYYLLREIASAEDGDFTYEKLEQRYNSDLAGGIGNFTARLLGISRSAERGSPNEAAKNIKIQATKNTKEKIKEIKESYNKKIQKFKFNEALSSVSELISYCDKYINEEKLWETKNEKVISDLFFALKEIADLLSPFLPETTEKIKKAIIEKKSENLFPRIGIDT
jgi:methionyl-tRNA synthetase